MHFPNPITVCPYKTDTFLFSKRYLWETKKNYGPHLIIVPNAVIVNWKSEIKVRGFPTEHIKTRLIAHTRPAKGALPLTMLVLTKGALPLPMLVLRRAHYLCPYPD